MGSPCCVLLRFCRLCLGLFSLLLVVEVTGVGSTRRCMHVEGLFERGVWGWLGSPAARGLCVPSP